jgi:hypothetical protein
VLPHPPNSSDHAPSDYHLFGPLKKIGCGDTITLLTMHYSTIKKKPVAAEGGVKNLLYGSTCFCLKVEEGC